MTFSTLIGRCQEGREVPKDAKMIDLEKNHLLCGYFHCLNDTCVLFT